MARGRGTGRAVNQVGAGRVEVTQPHRRARKPTWHRQEDPRNVLDVRSSSGWTGHDDTSGRLASQYTQGAVASDRRGPGRGPAPSLVRRSAGRRAVWHGSRTSVTARADENVQYRIGSITKTFTAVLVLRLRGRGRLDLGDPLEKHLPALARGGHHRPTPRHTGGWRPSRPGPVGGGQPGSSSGAPRCAGEQPLLHPVGAGTLSNPATRCWAHSWRAARCPVEDVLRREVLEPLGLDARVLSRRHRTRVAGRCIRGRCAAAEPVEDLAVGSGRSTLVHHRRLGSVAVFLAHGTIEF